MDLNLESQNFGKGGTMFFYSLTKMGLETVFGPGC